MTVHVWSGVQVGVQSALAAALTLSAISKANPGVATYTGSDPTNGAYALVKAQGMTEVNERVFRLASVNSGAKTVELDDEDTTAYGTFSSGTLEVVTFGASMTSAVNLSVSGGDPNFIDTTTIHSLIGTQIPGTPSPISYEFECLWDPADAGLVALHNAYKARASRAIRFTFADGTVMVFNGSIAASLVPGGSAQDRVTTAVSITMGGAPTYYPA